MRQRFPTQPAPGPIEGLILPNERWQVVVSRILMVTVLIALVAIVEGCALIHVLT